MPVTYRSHVAPRFGAWIADGYRRLHDHPAMQAGRELAARCLEYTYEPDPRVPRVVAWQHAASVMRTLRESGITPEQLMLRVAEMVALFEAEPSRCPNKATEEMALGRAVVHLVRWDGRGRGQGKALTLGTAQHVREHLYPWALAFVRRLGHDETKDRELKRQAATFE